MENLYIFYFFSRLYIQEYEQLMLVGQKHCYVMNKYEILGVVGEGQYKYSTDIDILRSSYIKIKISLC